MNFISLKIGLHRISQIRGEMISLLRTQVKPLFAKSNMLA